MIFFLHFIEGNFYETFIKGSLIIINIQEIEYNHVKYEGAKSYN